MSNVNSTLRPLETVVDITKIAACEEQKQIIREVLAHCKLDGIHGACFAASMANRDVLFRGNATIVVAFKAALADNGRIAGHSAVFNLDLYWDSEGDHHLEHITKYVRLDVEDEEYAT